MPTTDKVKLYLKIYIPTEDWSKLLDEVSKWNIYLTAIAPTKVYLMYKMLLLL